MYEAFTMHVCVMISKFVKQCAASKLTTWLDFCNLIGQDGILDIIAVIHKTNIVFVLVYIVLLEYFAGDKPLRMSQIRRKIDPLFLTIAFWFVCIYPVRFADFIVANWSTLAKFT